MYTEINIYSRTYKCLVEQTNYNSINKLKIIEFLLVSKRKYIRERLF